MLDLFRDNPGRLFLVATLLPLVPVVLMLLSGTVRNMTRSQGRAGGPQSSIYWLLGGDQPLKVGGYLALAAMLAAAACAVAGTVLHYEDAEKLRDLPATMEARWGENVDWIRIGPLKSDPPATGLQLGYRVDRLTALMVTMVTVVGSLIFLFSLGYMTDEAKEHTEDHEAHVHRRGRFGRFFLYLSLFAFSMLNLLIADNLFQVFVGWELVGVCSFFLIGFYYERHSASFAANKAFIMNRIGDAGFLIGIAIAWSAFGTLNIQELTGRFASGRLPESLTPWLWTVMGLGIFLGCVGKSAQFPLQTWLPDAMEGPTPVSALIHAATMVAAGVYLVGRCYPLFSPDVLLVIAYTGGITLFLAATIACVQTDIKRVLAYSTVSQLGFMMLALGVGGWAAGLFHLLTHACFKALLFLGSGSVIFGTHHQQDLKKMGGLAAKMPVTAYTMLIGVLAISGFPLLSGWYSKDMILSSALGYGLADRTHQMLFLLPVAAAGMTAYYMFRLWFLAFAGKPRDQHVYDHAHETPWVMTTPLVLLAIASIAVGWGWPVWNAEASYLGHTLHEVEPAAQANFAKAKHLAEENHLIAGGVALVAAAIGFGFAYGWHRSGKLLATKPNAFFVNKWYFDELYEAVFHKPTIQLAKSSAAADKRPAASFAEEPESRVDTRTLDGVLNAFGQLTARLGAQLREAQSGQIRQYVLVLALTVAGLLGILTALTR